MADASQAASSSSAAAAAKENSSLLSVMAAAAQGGRPPAPGPPLPRGPGVGSGRSGKSGQGPNNEPLKQIIDSSCNRAAASDPTRRREAAILAGSRKGMNVDAGPLLPTTLSGTRPEVSAPLSERPPGLSAAHVVGEVGSGMVTFGAPLAGSTPWVDQFYSELVVDPEGAALPVAPAVRTGAQQPGMDAVNAVLSSKATWSTVPAVRQPLLSYDRAHNDEVVSALLQANRPATARLLQEIDIAPVPEAAHIDAVLAQIARDRARERHHEPSWLAPRHQHMVYSDPEAPVSASAAAAAASAAASASGKAKSVFPSSDSSSAGVVIPSAEPPEPVRRSQKAPATAASRAVAVATAVAEAVGDAAAEAAELESILNRVGQPSTGAGYRSTAGAGAGAGVLAQARASKGGASSATSAGPAADAVDVAGMFPHAAAAARRMGALPAAAGTQAGAGYTPLTGGVPTPDTLRRMTRAADAAWTDASERHQAAVASAQAQQALIGKVSREFGTGLDSR